MSNQVFPSDFMDELKSKNDIVSVISRYVPLERKGNRFWGRCPFHNEKTPSFAVNQDEQFFHCFGCKESGDVISFVEKIESVDFNDAIKILADFAHLQIPEKNKSENAEAQTKRKKQCLNALRECALYYYNNLQLPEAEHAREYLKKRGISESIAKRFGIGFSLGFYEVIKYLGDKGYDESVLLDAGILKKRDGKSYDAVGGRLIIPVLNIFSEVVAFCGRTLKDKVDFAKYLNTAETIVFSKSKNLFGINFLKKKKQTTKIDYVIIVEGHIDVVSLHSAGFDNTVASMGTALTVDQAKLVKRFSDKVFICYDGDFAGQKATLRGLDILKEQGLDVKVVSLPDGMDPDDVIRKLGKQAYQKALDEALPLVEFKLASIKKQFDLKTLDGKTKYVEEALKVLSELSSEVERETYLEYVHEASGTNRDFLRRQIQDSSTKNKFKREESKMYEVKYVEGKLEEVERNEDGFDKAEKFVLACLFHKKIPISAEMSDFFGSKKTTEIFEFLIKNPNSFQQLYEKLGKDNDLVGEIIVFDFCINGKEKSASVIDKEFNDCVLLLKRNKLKKQQEELNNLIKNEPIREKRAELLQRLGNITKELSNLK